MQTSKLSDNQVEHWRQIHEESLADTQWVAHCKELDQERVIDQREMVELLQSYLVGKITTEELRATFDRKTRNQWDTFGLKGLSGAMFLNMLVKHVADEQALAYQLRSVLRLPQDVMVGRERMQVFLRFLEGLISSNQVTKRQIQPARTPFFISAWWHLQAIEQWPIFYPLTRQMFELEGLYTSSQNPIEDYFTFRETFLPLAAALGLTAWQLEHLSTRHKDQKRTMGITGGDDKAPTTMPSTNVAQVNVPASGKHSTTKTVLSTSPQQDEQADSRHTRIQWLLARMGLKFDCNVWIAANDHSKVYNGEKLGDLSLKSLPNLGMEFESQQIIKLIDVLWLKGKGAVVAAFEVEHTTSIYSGLLRLSDLVVSSPNINFPLYIVTPDTRLDKVRQELSRPTFQALELHKRCWFFSEEKLMQEAEHIMHWATSASAIKQLASMVGDVGG